MFILEYIGVTSSSNGEEGKEVSAEEKGTMEVDGEGNGNGNAIADIEKQQQDGGDGDGGDFKTVELTTTTAPTEKEEQPKVAKDFNGSSDEDNTNTNGLCYRCEKRDFVWSNVNMTLLKTKKGGVTEENTKLKILDNVWGKAQAGKTTAIMGAFRVPVRLLLQLGLAFA